MDNGLVPLGTSVKRNGAQVQAAALPLGTLGRPRSEKEATPLGLRILRACEEEGLTPTGAAAKAKISGGYIWRIIYGTRGNQSIDPHKLEALSDLLHVRFHWLATGREPMREGAWAGARSPREEAIISARRQGVGEDAIEHVLETMPEVPDTGQDERYWYETFWAEHEKRRRAGIPEKLAKKGRSKVRAEKRELERATGVPGRLKAPPAAAPPAADQEAATSHSKKPRRAG